MVERYRGKFDRLPIWERLFDGLAEEYRYGNSVCKLYVDLLVRAMVDQDPVLRECCCFHEYHTLKDKREYEFQQEEEREYKRQVERKKEVVMVQGRRRR
jgi:hypothetical protein